MASIFCCMGMGMTSCSNDVVNSSKVSISALPDGMENAVLSNAKITLKNVSTGETKIINKDGQINSGRFDLDVIDGIYNFAIEADITYTENDKEVNTKVRASKENVEIVGGAMELDLKDILYIYQADSPSGLVIAEIFFTGTETPENKQYNGDKYFKIYNNSNEVLYADGMAIAETSLQTINGYKDYLEKETQTDDRSSKTPIQALYRIPGNGTEHPVKPGEFLLIVDNAKNHKEANVNSFDLSKADFEWYDESNNPNFLDIDNPDVPNLDKIYCYTFTIWGPHNRGFHSYLLVDLGTDEKFNKDQFLQDNVYQYSYIYEYPGGSFTSNDNAYFVNNKDIVDAVNLSIESEFVKINIDKSLDQGWTYCGRVNKDTSRYGKSVRRKVLGGQTLKDTNDSSVDFLAEQTADPTYSFK